MEHFAVFLYGLYIVCRADNVTQILFPPGHCNMSVAWRQEFHITFYMVNADSILVVKGS
jgi:hypothetical protein